MAGGSGGRRGERLADIICGRRGEEWLEPLGVNVFVNAAQEVLVRKDVLRLVLANSDSDRPARQSWQVRMRRHGMLCCGKLLLLPPLYHINPVLVVDDVRPKYLVLREELLVLLLEREHLRAPHPTDGQAYVVVTRWAPSTS